MESTTDWVENIWNSKLTYFGLIFLFFILGYFNLMALVLFIGVCLVGPDDDFTEDELDEWIEFRSAFADECTLTESMELELIPDDLQDVLTHTNISIDLPVKSKVANAFKLKSKSFNLFLDFNNNHLINKPNKIITYDFYNNYNAIIKKDNLLNKFQKRYRKSLNKLFKTSRYDNIVNSKYVSQDKDTHLLLKKERRLVLKELKNITKLRVAMGFHSLDPYDYHVFINKDLGAYKKKLALKPYNKKKIKNRTLWR